jgi:hypothetical protein
MEIVIGWGLPPAMLQVRWGIIARYPQPARSPLLAGPRPGRHFAIRAGFVLKKVL